MVRSATQPAAARLRGIELLHNPATNKSTAYTETERQALELVGLVPDVTESEDLQLRRVLQLLGDKPTDLDRYIYLIQLLDNNETLFYRTVMSDPARFLPIVFDPTIGEACLKFGHTDEMFIEAAHAVADQVTPGHLNQGLLYPPQSNILETEIRTAERVATLVFERNLAGVGAAEGHQLLAPSAALQARVPGVNWRQSRTKTIRT